MGGWCQISVSRKRIWSKKGFLEKKLYLFLVGFGFTSLLLHDCHQMLQKGVPKNTIKIGFFGTPSCQMQKKQKKRRKKKERPKKKVTPKKWGAFKTGRKQFHFFFPKNRVFQNSLKPLFLQCFPKKMGGHHFFSKRLCYNEDTFRRAKKNDNFLLPFRQKCLRRCQSKKKGGVGGGRSPPQKGREKQSHGTVVVVFVVVGCCFLFFLLLLLLLLLLYL